MIDGLRGIVGRDRADRNREHGTDDRARGTVEPREPELRRRYEQVGDSEDEQALQHLVRRAAWEVGRLHDNALVFITVPRRQHRERLHDRNAAPRENGRTSCRGSAVA